jgi:hypothetical protein
VGRGCWLPQGIDNLHNDASRRIMGDARPHPPPRSRTRHERWRVFYGNVQVGTIGERVGVPKDVDQWGWICGFYPRASYGLKYRDGSSPTLEEACADFDAAWRLYLSGCTAEDFAVWRRQRAFTAWKYAIWDAGCRMPTQTVDGWTKCFCGAAIDNNSAHDHIVSSHMEVA